MSFADELQKMADEAPAAGFVNVNYGKLTTVVNVLKWVKGAPVRTLFKEGYELRSGETIDIEFTIHISELNPSLEFEFTRNVTMRTNSADGKFKSDWAEVVLPSLVAVFGKDWAKILSDKKQTLYVAAESVDSVVPVKEGKKVYSTVKFIEKYKNLATCKAARDAKYGSKDDVEDTEIGIPQSLVEQAKSLYAALNSNEAQFRPMLAQPPFNEYDADAILAEVTA